jgi:L-iditol 2-dehydrogenase
MKAVKKKEGEVGVEVVDVPYPELKPGRVIVKVKAAGICGSDLHTYDSAEPAWDPGQILGHEGAGEVVEVGEGVENFEVGNRVSYNPFAPRTNQFCGECYFCLTGQPLGCQAKIPVTKRTFMHDGGSMAEYQSINAKALYKLPDNVTYEVGALLEPFGVSYHGVLEASSLKTGQTIVILGPGTIGLFALIAAKTVTPKQVIITGTTKDEAVRFKLARELGVDVLINVDEDDPVKKVMELTDGVGADVVVEAVGIPLLTQGLKMLRYGGEYIAIGHPPFSDKTVASIDGLTYNDLILERKKILGSWIYDTLTWVRMIRLLERKLVNLKPLITHRLPLKDAVKGFELGLKQQCVKVMLLP